MQRLTVMILSFLTDRSGQTVQILEEQSNQGLHCLLSPLHLLIEIPYRVWLFIAPAYSKVRYRGSTFRPFICSFVHSSVRPSVRQSVHNSCQVALLCSSDSWKYETLHSNYLWHTLQAGTLTRCPWPSFHAPLTLSKFCVESRKFTSSLEIKFISFPAAVVAVRMKPCIVFVLYTHFKEAPWPGALDLQCCREMYLISRLNVNFDSESVGQGNWFMISVWRVCQGQLLCKLSYPQLPFSAAVVAVRMKPCIVIALDTPFRQAPWPSFHTPLTFSKFCVESRKLMSSLEIKFISLQQW